MEVSMLSGVDRIEYGYVIKWPAAMVSISYLYLIKMTVPKENYSTAPT